MDWLHMYFQKKARQQSSFGINQDTGKIYLVKPLDYEQTKRYSFKVIANGTGENSYDIANITVWVTDQNDNIPIFTKVIYEVTVHKVQTISPVLTVHATDADEDGKQKVKYLCHPISHKFIVHEDSGEVRIKDSKLPSGQYHLQIKAEDQGSPTKRKFCTSFYHHWKSCKHFFSIRKQICCLFIE